MEPATVAGLVAAEQAVSTTLEVGVPAAYGQLSLFQPKEPLLTAYSSTFTPNPAFIRQLHSHYLAGFLASLLPYLLRDQEAGLSLRRRR